MENQNFIFLNVKTVPAFDPIRLCPHTAYTVYQYKDNNLQFASGWTLQDAIEYFVSTYKYNRAAIRLKRPFKRQ